jgi:transmembrane sensor
LWIITKRAKQKYFYLNSMKPGPNKQYGEELATRVAWLVAGYLQQTLSEKEHDELDNWITASDENQQLFEGLTDPEVIEKGIRKMDETDTESALEKIKLKIHFTPTKTDSGKRRIWVYGIAASVLLFVGLFIVYETMLKTKKNETGISGINEIQPGGNNAMLTLANGEVINLKEARNGLIDSMGGIDVLKPAEGQLNYEQTGAGGNGFHILTTPTGGQYSVLLQDGTRVWLNAASSLKYPASFNGKERVVELSGEGYFEVVPHPQPFSTGGEGGTKTPFIVKLKDGVQVEVLGTHFNINAYSDEAMINATLLEGRVSLRHFGNLNAQEGNQSRELLPGQQAGVDVNGKWSVISKVDTSEAVAWKNGKFQFKDATIETIMRQVARWYDAEIVYEGKVDYHFNATTIYRSEALSKLLELLEATNRVHFRIEGRKVIVRP